MTTTQTITDTILCEECEDEIASHDVAAQHLDPDDDGTGRMIGWSKPIWTRLCPYCLVNWQCDDMIGICEENPL